MTATHGPSGTLAGLLGLAALRVAAVLLSLTIAPDTPAALAWIAGCTAGALLPDTDHHSSSPAKLWGPLTSVPCRWIGWAAGGHREGTHDISRGAPLLFAGVFALGLTAPAAYHLTGGPHALDVATRAASMAVVALTAGLTFLGVAALLSVRAAVELLFGRRTARRLPAQWHTEAPLNFAASWLVAAEVSKPYPAGLPWPVIAALTGGIACGVVVGIAGDGCTVSGIPWRNRRDPKPGERARRKDQWGRDNVHLLPYGWRIRTDSPAETRYVRTPILVAIVALAVVLAA